MLGIQNIKFFSIVECDLLFLFLLNAKLSGENIIFLNRHRCVRKNQRKDERLSAAGSLEKERKVFACSSFPTPPKTTKSMSFLQNSSLTDNLKIFNISRWSDPRLQFIYAQNQEKSLQVSLRIFCYG
jgi:hypothetical protein